MNLKQLTEATLLDPESSRADITDFVRRARELGCSRICLLPSMLPVEYPRVVALAGYPTGAHASLVKAAEARFAVEQGATEINVTAHPAAVKEAHTHALISELMTIREAVPRPAVLGVTLSNPHTSPDGIAAVVSAASLTGVDFIVTHSARLVPVISEKIRGAGARVGVKVRGDISTTQEAHALLQAGASRLGVSMEAIAALFSGYTDL